MPSTNIHQMIERIKLRGCNAYFIRDGGERYLVDTGIPGNLKRVKAEVNELDGIIITHAHYDHAGSAYEISEHFSCSIYAHRKDHPYLSGEREFRFQGFVGNFIKRLEKLRKMKNFKAKDISDLRLKSFEVIHLPGHTPGSIALRSNSTLICGDVLRAVKKRIFFGEYHLRASSKNFNWDNSEYVKSLYRLSEFGKLTVLPGHGEKISADGDKLMKIAERMKNGLGGI